MYIFTRQQPIENYNVHNSSGRISSAMLQDVCIDILKRRVFVCGPDQFMADVKTLVTQVGLAKVICAIEIDVAGARGRA